MEKTLTPFEVIYTDLAGLLLTNMTYMTQYFDPIIKEVKKDGSDELFKIFVEYYKNMDDIFRDNYLCNCKEISNMIGFNYNKMMNVMVKQMEENDKYDNEIVII